MRWLHQFFCAIGIGALLTGRGRLVDIEKADRIQRVLNDQQSVTLVEAVELRVEALRLGIECEVAESPVWGDYTLVPK
jgi:hypothetical protein